jgi:hypothetical protein
MTKKSIALIALLFVLAAALSLAACGKKELTDFAVEGGAYTGTTADGKTATGTGTIKFDNGNVFEGDVKDGKPLEGVMIDVISKGAYTGKFVDGKYEDSNAVMELDDGGIYTGAFAGGKMKGNCTFTWPDGTVFTGSFDGTGGAENTVGTLTGTGTLTYTTAMTYEGTILDGYPKKGKFRWPDDGPVFEGDFTGFLTGYVTLDMKNGVVYHGSMGLGLLVPIDSYTGDVTITYPVLDSGDYNGETFTGKYVHNDAENKDELKGTVTYKDGGKLENVMIALDFSFSYRYTATDYDVGGVTYTGAMRDNNVPYGAGVYQWPAGGATFTAAETHGWLTGYGALDMKNGIVYNGPLNDIANTANNGGSFQPYTTIAGIVKDTVEITHPAGVFGGKLTDVGTSNTSAAIKTFFGSSKYICEGSFYVTAAPDTAIPFLFIPTYAMGLYPIMTAATPVTVAGLPYVGQYIVVGTDNIAYGKGVSYWVSPDAAPRIESDFFFTSMTGIVKFTQTGYVYEGGMTLQVFGPECGQTVATVTFDNGDVFTGSWVEGALTGTIVYAAGGGAAGTVVVTLTACEFTAA